MSDESREGPAAPQDPPPEETIAALIASPLAELNALSVQTVRNPETGDTAKAIVLTATLVLPLTNEFATKLSNDLRPSGIVLPGGPILG